jgi:hypothetical protein
VKTWPAAGAEREVIFMIDIRIFVSQKALEILLEIVRILLTRHGTPRYRLSAEITGVP